VRDPVGRRRIVSKQLEAEEVSSQFVCVLCGFVMVSPVITSCSHLFCDPCLRTWAADQVSKQKNNASGDGKVPCPFPSCTAELRKKDILPIDKAGESDGGVQLIQRLRNNLTVRCVHHADLFGQPFGKDAERLAAESGVVCKWVGDFRAYEEHISRLCPVELRLRGRSPAGADKVERSAAPQEGIQVTPSQEASTPIVARPCPPTAAATATDDHPAAVAAVVGVDLGKVAGASGAGVGCRNGNGLRSADTAEEPALAEPSPKPGSFVPTDRRDIRVAKFDYNPAHSLKAQLPLKANDCVRVMEVRDSGWAAGVKICRETSRELGQAGWFPIEFLFPLGAAAP